MAVGRSNRESVLGVGVGGVRLNVIWPGGSCSDENKQKATHHFAATSDPQIRQEARLHRPPAQS